MTLRRPKHAMQRAELIKRIHCSRWLLIYFEEEVGLDRAEEVCSRLPHCPSRSQPDS